MVKRVTIGAKRKQVFWLIGAILGYILDVVDLNCQDRAADRIGALVPRLVKDESFCFNRDGLPGRHRMHVFMPNDPAQAGRGNNVRLPTET